MTNGALLEGRGTYTSQWFSLENNSFKERLKYLLFYFLSCSVWNWEEGVRMNYIVNNNPKVSRITSMGFLNAHDLTLLLTGTGKNQTYSPTPPWNI